ncbi:MAG TPA: hypothetical protein VGP89_17995 [Candidatus Angelobacter sp.]|jgi:hypothetical protein|nr:hypothetical protein [Candidatus Angelobacter sp.]
MRYFPFVTRSHHEDMVAELRSQLAAKESERQKFIDILAQMGWGVKVFGSDDQPEIEETPEQAQASTPTVPLSRMRPSQAARVISHQKQRDYDEKLKTVRRDEVLQGVAAIIGDKLAR